MSGTGMVGVAVLALLDEPRVLGEAARVEEERQPVSVAHLAHGSQVRQDTGWPPPELLVTVTNTTGTFSAPRSLIRASSASVSMLPLNGWIVAGSRPSGMTQVDRLGAGELDVGAGRVEVGVRRDHLARSADDAEQDLLGGSALVGRDDVAERATAR